MNFPIVLIHFSPLKSGQPLYSGQISWSQCVLYKEVPLYNVIAPHHPGMPTIRRGLHLTRSISSSTQSTRGCLSGTRATKTALTSTRSGWADHSPMEIRCSWTFSMYTVLRVLGACNQLYHVVLSMSLFCMH